MQDPEPHNLFFDFVFVGSQGGFERIADGGTWRDPWVKPVKTVSLIPGKSIEVAVSLPLPELDALQSWWLLVIYRDHAYGHSPTYPEFGVPDAVWRGAAASNLIALSPRR